MCGEFVCRISQHIQTWMNISKTILLQFLFVFYELNELDTTFNYAFLSVLRSCVRESEIDSGLLHTLTRISWLFHLRFVNSIITIDFIVQSLSRSSNNNNNNGFNSLQISYVVANGWWVKRYTGNTHTQADSDTDSALPVAFPSAESSYEIPYETGFWSLSFFFYHLHLTRATITTTATWTECNNNFHFMFCTHLLLSFLLLYLVVHSLFGEGFLAPISFCVAIVARCLRFASFRFLRFFTQFRRVPRRKKAALQLILHEQRLGSGLCGRVALRCSL